MTEIATVANPDLEVTQDNKANWNLPDQRRQGFHNLHLMARYTESFRARRVMPLRTRMDMRIPEMAAVARLTGHPAFSAMVVIRGGHVLFERYAPDFGPDRPHSTQSISKTIMHLVIGRLTEEGALGLGDTVEQWVPEIGSGYRGATVQQVLDMDVCNAYTEDFTDPAATYWRHEVSMGFRLPADGEAEPAVKDFLCTITSDDTTNRTGVAQYKDANCDLLAWIAERASGRPMRAFLAEIADAAGIEGRFHMTTDVTGFPSAAGGLCLTARDLARYGALLVRRGLGVNGRRVGSAAFTETTLGRGVRLAPPRERLRYSNQTNTDGRWLGHGGYGGQYMLCDLTSGVVGVYFSVIEDKDAYPLDFYPPLIAALEAIGRLSFDD